MKPSLFQGRGVVLRKKFERVSLTPDRMWRSRRIRSGVPVSALNCLMRRYRVLSCLRYKTIDVCRVLSCHHYKIIAVLRYAIARLCQNHKKAGWESSGCSTRRAVRWFTSQPEHASNTEPQVTVSVPVDSNNYWYGVLGMSIPVRTMQQFLRNAIDKNLDGEYQLYDSKLRFLTSSNPDHPTGNIFDPRELALLAQAMEHDTRGGIRMDSRYVSWERLDHFDGVLVRVHTLSEGVRGDFGSISIALTLLWALFTTMLLISWYVIRRMVSNMYVLQSSLQWQAWHDTLTRLYNRGALFEKARPLAKLCQTHQHPFSVIQVDLDHFKAINDRFGHQAGDRVLSHAAGLISSSLRAQDIAGRVGGEEFCVILPGASLTEAAEVAERIRLKLNEKEMLIAKSTTIRISASLGVSSSEETGDYDFEQLQSLADRRLYLAKQAGRNRVCASDNA